MRHPASAEGDAANPLMPADAQAGWKKSAGRVDNLDPLIRDELSARVSSGQYVFSIQAAYGMRMMTPARKAYFDEQNCASTPEGL